MDTQCKQTINSTYELRCVYYYNPLCEMAFKTVETVIGKRGSHFNPRLKSEANR